MPLTTGEEKPLAITPRTTCRPGKSNFGARFIRALTDAGLVNIAAEARTHLVAAGTENWTRGTVQHLAEHMLSSGLVTVSDIELFLL